MPQRRVVRLSVKRADGSLAETGINVIVADDFVGRLVGLLTRRNLHNDAGLLLVPCGSIHSFGMRFLFDAIFLDRDGRVLRCADNVPPNRLRFAPEGTVQVLEIAQGNRIHTGINLDDQLIFG